MKKVVIGTLSFMLMFITTLFNPVYAIEKQDEYIKVDYTVDNLSDNTIQMKLTLTNTSNIELTNLKINNNLPKQFELVENYDNTIISLQPQEQATKIFLVKEKNVNGNMNNDTPNGSTSNGNMPNSSTSNGNMSNSSTSNGNTLNNSTSNGNTSSSNTADKPKTGDTINCIIPLFGIIISSILIYFIYKKKKFRKLFILFIVGTIALSNIKLVQALNREKIIHVEKDIKVKDQTYRFSTDITYTVDDIINNEKITRIEWLTKLVNAMHYQDIDFSNLDEPYFSDVIDKNNEKIINYAVTYRIIDTDQEKFYPNAIATREFISVTTVKALGYEPITDFQCADHNLINEPKYVETAIGIKAISLENNYFYPQRAATVSESNQALDVVNKTLDSEQIDANGKENVIYKDGVENINENDVINVQNNIVILTNNEKNSTLKVGNIIIVNNEAYKICSKTVNGNELTFNTSKPQLEEVINSMDIEGYGVVDYNHIEVAEGVTCTVENKNPKFARALDVDTGGESDFNSEASLKISTTISDVKVALKFEPKKIKYRINLSAGLFSGIDVQDLLFKVDNDIDLSLSYEKDTIGDDDKTNLRKKLLTIPLVTGIFSADLAIYAELTLEGKIIIKYTVACPIGIQIKNNRPRNLTELKSKGFSAEAKGELKIGVSPSIDTTVLGFDLMDLGLSAGVAGEGKIELRKIDCSCLDIKSYLYLEIGWLKKEKSIIKDLFEKLNVVLTLDFSKIIDENNSPFKYNGHFEGMIGSMNKVEKCTFKNATIEGTVVSQSTKNPIGNCIINIIDLDSSKTFKRIVTNTYGKFKVKMTADINYILAINHDGYESFKSNTINLEEDENKTIDIQLKPITVPNPDDEDDKSDVNEEEEKTGIYYLENRKIIDKGQYMGNQGDSFIYTIGKGIYSRGNEDINGNKYDHGLEVWLARWNFKEEQSWTYATYDLKGEYNMLTGNSVIIKSANTTDFDSTLEFYGDGKLLKSYNLTPQSIPFDIELDVTGVKSLKINACDNGYFRKGTSIGLVDMKLTK